MLVKAMDIDTVHSIQYICTRYVVYSMWYGMCDIIPALTVALREAARSCRELSGL